MAAPRPHGISSRVHAVAGERRSWQASNGEVIELPLCVDIQQTADLGRVDWRIEATVGLHRDEPVVTQVHFACVSGLDLERLQSEFRWATPLEIVTTAVPALIAQGRDPFEHDFATSGYPDAAHVGEHRSSTQLTDEFLRYVAELYVRTGRGYARRIAELYTVSPRTAISWIEKARKRGILTATSKGVQGGSVLPREDQGAP